MKTTPTTKILAIGTINPILNNRRCLLSYQRKFGKLSTSTPMARSSSGTRYRESRAWRSSSTSPIRLYDEPRTDPHGPLNPLRVLQVVQPKP